VEINSGAFDPKKMMRIPFGNFPREQAEFMRVDEDLSDSVQLLAGSLAPWLARWRCVGWIRCRCTRATRWRNSTDWLPQLVLAVSFLIREVILCRSTT